MAEIFKNNPENILVISAALTGAATSKEQNPAVPYTPEEFGDEAKKCYEAGAAIVHIHARDPETGNPTADLKIIKEVLDNIHEKAPEILINLSSAIGGEVTQDQRIAPIQAYKPPLASLNTNSMNFSIGNFKTGEVVFYANGIFQNHFEMIQTFAKHMKKAGTKPEMEIYDLGGMHNILFLNKQDDLFERPLHFQFVFGVLGGAPFSPGYLETLLNLKPQGATWSVCGVARQQFQAGMCAAAWNGHIRVGLEDNIRMPNGELAKGSYEQVAWAKKVADLYGRETVQGEKARKVFNLLREDVELG